jgi:hypothetical protein
MSYYEIWSFSGGEDLCCEFLDCGTTITDFSEERDASVFRVRQQGISEASITTHKTT